MKTLIIALILATATAVYASPPTGTVTRTVSVYTNGVLVDTNFTRINGIVIWQNPTSATNWTWTSDGRQITLTGYSGPPAVVIPDALDGLPVTGIGTVLSGTSITNVSGGQNIQLLPMNAFYDCASLVSISMPSVVGLEFGVFDSCPALTSVDLPQVTTIKGGAFFGCSNLVSISLTQVSRLDDQTFSGCTSLVSVVMGRDAPAEATDVFLDAAAAIVYVVNPTATGWGTTWNSRPVVRLSLYGPVSALQISGSTWRTNQVMGIDGTTNTLIYLGAP